MPHAFAATRPVNTPGMTPVITEEQLWKGLEYKARNPQAFVPAITSCKVTVDEGDSLTREVTFAFLPPGKVITETIQSYPSTIVYFEMDTGGRVTNTVSSGPDGELLLTYAFAGEIPGVPPNEPKPSAEQLNAMVGGTIEGSLETVRKLIAEGRI